jgi:hypothetical protein
MKMLKHGIETLVKIEPIWAVLDATVLRLARYADEARRHGKAGAPPEVAAIAEKLIPDLRVRHGVFAGMRYPSVAARGSTLFPKLIGSYERELHPIVERICREPYAQIIDVGCAEGFYAVGLAMRMPHSRVLAYDTNPQARELCGQMAALNGVSDRVIIGEMCDGAVLKRALPAGRTLVLSDCEGYEARLFTDDVVAALAGHDVLVELHDFVDIEISPRLRARFSPSHEVESVLSVHDIKKGQEYLYDELASYDLDTRRRLLAESRPATMEWFYLRSKAPLSR